MLSINFILMKYDKIYLWNSLNNPDTHNIDSFYLRYFEGSIT